LHPEATDRKALIPALIGVGVCLFLPRGGVLGFFFLVPLGFISYRYGSRIAWNAFLLAVLGNAVLAFGTVLARGFPLTEVFWDILYFTVMTSIFTAISAPPPALSERASEGMRFIIGSCLGALLFTGIFLRTIAAPGISDYLGAVLNSLVLNYQASGSDVVQKAIMESMTPEMVLDLLKSIMLRGGSLVSSVFMFFLCRQLSYALAYIVQRRQGITTQGVNSLVRFHVYPVMIWVLSGSLLLVVLTRMVKLEIPEILLWNILILCGILYFAQGLGVLQFLLARPTVPPFLRLLLSVLFVFLFFSPGINVVLLAGIVLLGIAENWVPIRAPKSNGPPSTPEAGDGGD